MKLFRVGILFSALCLVVANYPVQSFALEPVPNLTAIVDDPTPAPAPSCEVKKNSKGEPQVGHCSGSCADNKACRYCKVTLPRCVTKVKIGIPPGIDCKVETREVGGSCECEGSEGASCGKLDGIIDKMTDCFQGEVGDFCKKEGQTCSGDKTFLCESGSGTYQCNDGKGGKYTGKGKECPTPVVAEEVVEAF